MLTVRLMRTCANAKILNVKDFKFNRVTATSNNSESFLTPKTIFEMLDKRVVGQAAAKRMLAIAYSTIK